MYDPTFFFDLYTPSQAQHAAAGGHDRPDDAGSLYDGQCNGRDCRVCLFAASLFPPVEPGVGGHAGQIEAGAEGGAVSRDDGRLDAIVRAHLVDAVTEHGEERRIDGVPLFRPVQRYQGRLVFNFIKHWRLHMAILLVG